MIIDVMFALTADGDSSGLSFAVDVDVAPHTGDVFWTSAEFDRLVEAEVAKLPAPERQRATYQYGSAEHISVEDYVHVKWAAWDMSTHRWRIMLDT